MRCRWSGVEAAVHLGAVEMTLTQEHDLTVMMLSQMGSGDGGRETWLLNFLTEVVRQRRPVRFHAIHRATAGGSSLLDLPGVRGLIVSVKTVACDGKRIPVTVEFLARVAWERCRGRVAAPGIVIAVGGLSEALATVALGGDRRNRVLWLRTIYSKEKAYRVPRLFRRVLLALELFVIRHFFGLVLANGDDTAAFYQEQGIDCVVIKNAIQLAAWRMPPLVLSDRLRIAFIGRLSEVKGIAAFLDTVELAHAEGKSDGFEFIVAGDGPYRGRVEALMQAGRLSYRGQLENSTVVDLVAEVDCCVALTYLTDELGGGGVSNALIEQMAAGRIIVAWDNAIFRTVVSSASAYLVDQGNVAALLQTFVAIEEDRGAALSKARIAMRVSGAYAIEVHVDRFFEVRDSTGLAFRKASGARP
jgi:glycosyltransferase involved in cell wall biosynthesis